jgi:hypothetical protein
MYHLISNEMAVELCSVAYVGQNPKFIQRLEEKFGISLSTVDCLLFAMLIFNQNNNKILKFV